MDEMLVPRTVVNPTIFVPALTDSPAGDLPRKSGPTVCPVAVTIAPSKPSKKKKSTPNPDHVSGTYTRDYDITKLHAKILHKLQAETQELPQLNTLLNGMQQELLRTGAYLPHVKYTKLAGNIEELRTKIAAIQSGQRLIEYNDRVDDLLTKYAKLSGKIRVIFFDQESSYSLTQEDYQRLDVIERYIEVAKGYLDLDLRRVSLEPKDLCVGCGASLANVQINDNQMRQCIKCETEHFTLTTVRHPKDNAKMTIGGSGDDDSIDNFIKALTRYQGLQADVPDPKVYSDLDKYFQKYGKPTGEIIRALPLNAKGRRGNTDHAMLLNALKCAGWSEYYEHVNLIGHIYWGWLLPNVSEHEDTIIRHYHATQAVYRSIPIEERGRISSLGTQLRLYLHLRLVGHECDRDNFKIAQNVDSISNQIVLWQRMCAGCDEPDIHWERDMY